MPETHLGRTYIGGNSYDFENKSDFKRYLMEKFSNKMSYFPNFHYSKKDLKHNNQLTIETWMGTVTYFCSIPCKRRKGVVVGIRFEWCLLSEYRY